ncbi:MAG: type II toxin-antitoxin system VapC family toxin [Gammaproteobacteria bacterium]|nr:type II toxin-antitoxin system VapC family toxin [Gammaproteobacteria bacterium]
MHQETQAATSGAKTQQLAAHAFSSGSVLVTNNEGEFGRVKALQNVQYEFKNYCLSPLTSRSIWHILNLRPAEANQICL